MEIELPPPDLKGNISVEEAIAKRRSVRSFTDKELTLKEISQLLWSAQGITKKKWGLSLRSAPSAGATYPLEVYCVKKDGVFKYIPEEHKLLRTIEEDKRDELARAALGQEYVKDAPIDIVITGIYERTTGRYGERGKMYVHIEVGHAAENVHLQAVALGLGSVPIGAFIDAQVKQVLKLPKNEEPLYIIPVGHPK